jgi:signal transduction histidine kinase
MADADEPAAALVELGWDGNQLDDVLAPFASDEERLVVATWLAASALVRRLVAEVTLASGQISQIVGAVREYTYLDRASLAEIDVAAGIESTLVILRSRLRPGVELRRAYAPGLPRIEAHGSELNQVWTNLVGNAIDALGGRGSIEISARPGARGEGAIVEVRDSGPGIPAEVRDRIFDPFFTTKDVGAGTGLGLHLARAIVERHGGRLELAATGPEGTTFRVTLPARPPAATDAGAAPAGR